MQLLRSKSCFSLITLYVGINVQVGPTCASGLRKSSAVICPGLQPQLRFGCHPCLPEFMWVRMGDTEGPMGMGW